MPSRRIWVNSSLKNLGVALLALGFLACSGAVLANPEKQASLQEILAQQGEIAADIEAGNYDQLPARSISAIKRAQKIITNVTEGRSELSQLPPEDQVHLQNALQTVKAQLAGTREAVAEQQVCWRERTVGSKIAVTRCGSEAEREEVRVGARGFMERARNCTPPDCGS